MSQGPMVFLTLIPIALTPSTGANTYRARPTPLAEPATLTRARLGIGQISLPQCLPEPFLECYLLLRQAKYVFISQESSQLILQPLEFQLKGTIEFHFLLR